MLTKPPKSPKHILLGLLKSATFISIGVFVGCSALLFFMQARMLVPPFGADRVDQTIAAPRPTGLAAQRLQITAPDGVELGGWFVPPRPAAGVQTTATKAPLIVLFMGNYEEPSETLRLMQPWFPGAALLAFNYRGQGLSGGSPSEAALFADALQVVDLAKGLPGVDAGRLRLFGRSLGTGVAVYVATQRSVERMVLLSPYDSIRAVAQAIYPWAPVKLLLRHPFDSLARAPQVNAPALIIVGELDTLIKPANSQRLADAWGGKHTVHQIAQADHNGILDEPQVQELAVRFLLGDGLENTKNESVK
jgi:uncharacterized protein